MPNSSIREKLLRAHVDQLLACRLCPGMVPPSVSGGPVLSRVLLVGQAPGVREPILGRPFAWTAGKRLFSWFNEAAGVSEENFRAHIYMAAVCRCFPGKNSAGGDRVPNPAEIENCSQWLRQEIELLQPRLVIPIGRLAIERFIECPRMDTIIGQQFEAKLYNRKFDLIPLPHPSGASPWPRIEPGKTLLARAMTLIAKHPAFIAALPKRNLTTKNTKFTKGA
jgi:uracil-DNA glycosylase